MASSYYLKRATLRAIEWLRQDETTSVEQASVLYGVPLLTLWQALHDAKAKCVCPACGKARPLPAMMTYCPQCLAPFPRHDDESVH